MGQVWQQEEVTITMIQFQLWCRHVVSIQVEVRHEETLYISLRLDAVTNGRYLGVRICQELQSVMPLAIVGHIIKIVFKLIRIQGSLFFILL